MSQRESITIKCPECGQEHPFTIWPSINTKINPEMKAKVRDMTAFEFVCPDCGEKIVVSYDFLYHQMEDGIKIFCAITDENYKQVLEILDDKNLFSNLDNNNPFKDLELSLKDMYNTDNTRIVRNYNEFLEKLIILDDQLDDRIVEFLKLLTLVRFEEIYPKSFENIDIYYAPHEEDQINFEIYGDGEMITNLTLPKDMYDGFYELYHKYLEKADADSFEINLDWALDTQELITKLAEEEAAED